MRHLINIVENAEPSARRENADKVYYHGTTAEFDGPPRASANGVYGPGVYLSKYRKVALNYAQRNGSAAPHTKAFSIQGKLANDTMLTAALAQAGEEGFRLSKKAARANEILADQGYVGIEDGPVTVVFDPRNLTIL